MDDLVSEVSREIAAQDRAVKVSVVRLEIGRRSCAAPHALLFCFEVSVHGTPLEGAKLEIIETDGAELRLKEVEVIDVHDVRM
jgi:Zn finger protein HypA/HybF involved in hydrogenase expression